MCLYRHSEKSSRPSFSSLHDTLTGEPGSLLQWRDEEGQDHPQVAYLLGAPLEAGKSLHTELQKKYLHAHAQ